MIKQDLFQGCKNGLTYTNQYDTPHNKMEKTRLTMSFQLSKLGDDFSPHLSSFNFIHLQSEQEKVQVKDPQVNGLRPEHKAKLILPNFHLPEEPTDSSVWLPECGIDTVLF